MRDVTPSLGVTPSARESEPSSAGETAPLLRRRGPGGIAGVASIALASFAALLSALALALPLLDGTRLVDLVQQNLVTSIAVGASFAVVGSIVLVRDGRNRLGWVFLAAGLLQALSSFGAEYSTRGTGLPGTGVAAFLAAYAWYPGMVILLTLVAPLFPTGRFTSTGWRILGTIGLIVTVASFSIVLTAQPLRDTAPGVRDPFATPPSWEPALETVEELVLAVAVLCALAGIAGMIVRLVRSSGSERRSSVWFVGSFLIGVVAQLLEPVSPLITTVAWTLVPVAWAVAITRHGLFEGDRLLNRTLVYSVLTVFVGAVFGLIVGFAGTYLGGAEAGAVVAAIAIALAIDPIRRFAQLAVERLLYGQRRDPFAAIEALGTRLTETLAPQDAPGVIVSTVTDALQLPFASITLEGERLAIASSGTATANRVELPLENAGARVGALTVGLRAGQRFLDPTDERLLLEIGRQAGSAAEAVRRERELVRSREALAVARETERDRIRRDLHDGLGPALAGVALGLGAATKSLADIAPDTAELLATLQSEVRDSLSDVKALVADLRPQLLETDGLSASIERYASVLTERSLGALQIIVHSDIPLLPDELQTALYRIVLEALTNVARHSGASECVIELHEASGAVSVTVTDNGVGIGAAKRTSERGAREAEATANSPSPSHSGIGLRSMAARAREQGGELRVEPGPHGGTVVRAQLPLAAVGRPS